MLTLQQLKDMPPATAFATGVTTEHRLNPQPIRWIAKRGGFWDWAIYYHFAHMPEGYILTSGDKIISNDIIQRLVPCDEEALKMYRK